LEQWLRDHPECGVAGPRVLDADGAVQESARRFPGRRRRWRPFDLADRAFPRKLADAQEPPGGRGHGPIALIGCLARVS
jgi:hypothetical protein